MPFLNAQNQNKFFYPLPSTSHSIALPQIVHMFNVVTYLAHNQTAYHLPLYVAELFSEIIIQSKGCSLISQNVILIPIIFFIHHYFAIYCFHVSLIFCSPTIKFPRVLQTVWISYVLPISIHLLCNSENLVLIFFVSNHQPALSVLYSLALDSTFFASLHTVCIASKQLVKIYNSPALLLMCRIIVC